ASTGGSRQRSRVGKTSFATKFSAEKFGVSAVEISQEGEREEMSIEFPSTSDSQRRCARTKFLRKITRRVIHVDANADDRHVRCAGLGSHFHEHAGDLALININVVRRSHSGWKLKLI